MWSVLVVVVFALLSSGAKAEAGDAVTCGSVIKVATTAIISETNLPFFHDELSF